MPDPEQMIEMFFHKFKNTARKIRFCTWDTNSFTIFLLKNFWRKNHAKH